MAGVHIGIARVLNPLQIRRQAEKRDARLLTSDYLLLDSGFCSLNPSRPYHLAGYPHPGRFQSRTSINQERDQFFRFVRYR
jgi:hypothetical protein